MIIYFHPLPLAIVRILIYFLLNCLVFHFIMVLFGYLMKLGFLKGYRFILFIVVDGFKDFFL